MNRMILLSPSLLISVAALLFLICGCFGKKPDQA